MPTPMPTPVPLPMALSIAWFFLGIIFSIIIPLVVIMVRGPRPLEGVSFFNRVIDALKKYWGNNWVQKIIGAVILSFFIVFILDLEFFKARDATIAGIGWESLLNKIFGGSVR